MATSASTWSSRKGNCTGAFAALDLAAAGLDGLFAAGRVNGDSRFVDVNADGKPDIYSDVRSAANVTDSRAILHVNQGNGSFLEEASVAALGIGGQGGTVVAADFDNDGDVDIFAPHDWSGSDGGRNWLLVNNGAGSFTDNAAAAGTASGPGGAAYVPGGGQAVDFNEDGRVDLLFGSRLMVNNGDGTFSDGSAAAGADGDRGQGHEPRSTSTWTAISTWCASTARSRGCTSTTAACLAPAPWSTATPRRRAKAWRSATSTATASRTSSWRAMPSPPAPARRNCC